MSNEIDTEQLIEKLKLVKDEIVDLEFEIRRLNNELETALINESELSKAFHDKYKVMI